VTAFTLRDATPEDVPVVHRLVRGLAEYERKLDKFTATVADYHRVLFGPRPYAQAILAEAGGRVVGVALYHTTISTFTCSPGYFLEDLFIEAEQRGSGLGRAFFAELARRLKAEGGKQIDWRVLKWNAPSIAFYQRLGAEGDPGEWDMMSLSGDALARLTA
jgi:GNAT superfamily N-acetyltransferase